MSSPIHRCIQKWKGALCGCGGTPTYIVPIFINRVTLLYKTKFFEIKIFDHLAFKGIELEESMLNFINVGPITLQEWAFQKYLFLP